MRSADDASSKRHPTLGLVPHALTVSLFAEWAWEARDTGKDMHIHANMSTTRTCTCHMHMHMHMHMHAHAREASIGMFA